MLNKLNPDGLCFPVVRPVDDELLPFATADNENEMPVGFRDRTEVVKVEAFE